MKRERNKNKIEQSKMNESIIGSSFPLFALGCVCMELETRETLTLSTFLFFFLLSLYVLAIKSKQDCNPVLIIIDNNHDSF